MLKLIPSPVIIVSIIFATSCGTEEFITNLTVSVEIDNAAVIVAINATSGIIVMTIKKASCPGNIRISGFINNLNIFSTNSLAFSIFSPFYL